MKRFFLSFGNSLRQPRVALWLAGLLFLSIIALSYYYFLTPASRSRQTERVCIDRDDTIDSLIAKIAPFAPHHARTGLFTLLSHTAWRDSVLTGRYAVEPDMSIFALFRRLKNGQQAPLMLTVPEARTLPRLAAILSQRIMADSAEIVSAMRDSLLIDSLGYDSLTLPAMFVPDTYEVYWNVSPARLLLRMKREHDRFWTYQRLHKASALGLTDVQVATLASIIDEETAHADEKPMIARMYLNRLRIGMPLQADPTIRFALGDFSIRRVYNQMLTVESPFNTYTNTGLPPGPIKIASVKGIDAVLNPASHDFLYMCAKEDFSGTHNFARSYQEHLKNARRYAEALNSRGIK